MRTIALVLAALAVLGAAASAQAQERPNVVVVMTDDQTVESMRVMTNVKSLVADQGTTFARSFVSFSLCCPSRATFLTGQYSHNHGVRSNRPPSGGFYRLDSSNTLPVWLQRAGYHTGHIGKYLNGYGTRNATEIPPGWSEWYGSVDPSTYRFYGYTLNENGRLVAYGNDHGSYQADVYTAKATDFIRRRAPGGPFFLNVAYLAPHAGGPREPGDPPRMGTPVPAPRHVNRFANEPLPRPPSFNELDVSDKPSFIRNRPLLRPGRINAIQENYQQRLESLLAVDEGVAAIVNALQQTGELDDTLIVVTADNGFFYGEHRLPNGKVLVYEPSVRVPLVMRGPGVPRGRSVGNLVANVDVAPTILDAADALANRPTDGRSLFPLMRDPTLEWGRDILLETTGVGNQSYSAIRTRRFLYAEHSNGDRELYDLPRDPFELANKANDARYNDLRQVLARRLADLRNCSSRSCRTRPKLKLSVRYNRGRSNAGTCASGPVRATVSGGDADLTNRVIYYVDGHRAASDGRRPFTRLLANRRFDEQLSVLRARASLRDGRVVTLDRGVRACP
jgi:N-acetylglucosamine-6-sulfatase